MGESRTNFVSTEVCELKRKSTDTEIDSIKENVEHILEPTTGYIAAAKQELEKRIERVDAKLNGLIMFLITTGTGTVIAVATELYRKYGGK